MDKQPVRSVETDALRIAYVEHGPTADILISKESDLAPQTSE